MTERIAIISDIHGNLPAFETVLADIAARGIETIYCLGDVIGKGPDGAAAVDLCRAHCIATVQGNWDANAAEGYDHPSYHWNRPRLGRERLDWLGALPGTVEFVLSGQRVRLFHASQQSPFHRVHQYDAFENHAAMFENTDFTGHGPTPDYVGYGDIHIAYVKSFRHKCLFNVGSVGNALDIPLATYAVLEGDTGPAPLSLSIIRLPYDIELATRQAEASGMPDLEDYADELRTARYRGLKRK
ncbi:metallophosphoesterase family protein [Devosia sp.]|uniref:metallophosphoesterase family protein n=1 Tax=Devosia sp. TaxID=1871048 RepID=UPI003A926342